MSEATPANETDQNSSRKRKRDEPPPSPESWNQLTKVLVGAGEAQKEFQVHTHILRKIPFFRACLDADMVEKQENCVRLPEDDADTFLWIVCWSYNQRFPCDLVADVMKECKSLSEGDKFSKKLHDDLLFMIKANVMARKFMFEDLQNNLLDLFREMPGVVYLGTDAVKIIIDMLPPDDGFYLMAKQWLAWHITQVEGGWHEWKKGDSLYSRFAATEVRYMEFAAEAVIDYPKSKLPREIGRPCDLHTHIDTPKCSTPAKKARRA